MFALLAIFRNVAFFTGDIDNDNDSRAYLIGFCMQAPQEVTMVEIRRVPVELDTRMDGDVEMRHIPDGYMEFEWLDPFVVFTEEDVPVRTKDLGAWLGKGLQFWAGLEERGW